MRLILASTSPRRREILALLGLPFEVIAPCFEEVVAGHRPIEEEVLDFAIAKAASVAAAHPHSVVIGSDTMISIDGEKFGKPTGANDAKRMLRVFSGRRHRIFTSVAILDGAGGPGLHAVEEVSVVMRAFTDKEIESYLACGESLDKAGAYSIQGEGRRLIDSIEGDFLAAVGMPLRPIARYFQKRGVGFPLDVEKIYSEKSFLNWRAFHGPACS
ncbi:MAG: Maf family protein [Deltaproteobacteria bacterium]|nr:Maf family protein [Deltaproteobacteria bacterium]